MDSPIFDVSATSRIQHVETDILWGIKRNIFAGISFDFEKNASAKLPENITLPENYYDYTLYGGGYKLRYDARDLVYWTTKGFYVDVDMEFFSVSFLEKTSLLTTIDVQYFTTLFSKADNTLAFRVRNSYGSRELPLSYLPTSLGRAFHPNQYRAVNATELDVDYQVKAWRFLYPSLFFEQTFLSQSYAPWVYSVGGGLRFKISKQKRVFVRLEYAVGSNQSSAVLLSFNNAYK